MLNDFYTVNNWQTGEQELSCTLAYNADHAIFQGHFPQQPVVPGVCTMQIIKELLEKAMGKRLLLTEAAQVKFLQLLLPEDESKMTASWKHENNIIKATVNLLKKDMPALKMIATYNIAD